MEIYLIRHTAPAVAKGVCYGQADLDVTASFYGEAAIIQQYLPADIKVVYSSPLQRCKRLADHLFTAHTIQLHDGLMEINCGRWELQKWDDIPTGELDPWMKDLINVSIPGGESYREIFDRVVQVFDQIIAPTPTEGTGEASVLQGSEGQFPLAIVAHGGVIRSILSHITQTPLADSFKAFSLHYGCVIKVTGKSGSLRYDVLSNIPREKETHKPSNL